jgi:hypothetical protein
MTATVQGPISVGWVRQRREWAGTTPGWLRAATMGLVGLAVATGVVASVTVLTRSHAVNAARSTAEPLVVDASTAVVKLSGTNATVAEGFLSGSVIPPAVVSSFNNDLAQAATSLTAAAQRAGTDRRVTGYLQTLETDLPVYSGIIATAEADNRQGQPVGAAYLAEANHFMNAGLLPAASSLYAAEQAGLSHEDHRATAAVPEIVVIILLATLLGVLVYLQVGLAHRFHRLLNVGCVVASLAVVTMLVWLVVALAGEGSAVSRAEKQGSNPLGVFTQARILAGQARADDELTLVIRDANSALSYQKDYAAVSGRLTNLISRPRAGWTASETQTELDAASVWQGYGEAHQMLRAQDASQPSGDVMVDQQQTSPQALIMDTKLADGVDAAVSSFVPAARQAHSDLDGLIWVSVILMALVVIGVFAGTRPRLREYR